MSPLTAVLKCPHYEKGHYGNESEREAEVPSHEDGRRRELYVAGYREIDGDLQSARKTAEEKTTQGRGQGISAW